MGRRRQELRRIAAAAHAALACVLVPAVSAAQPAEPPPPPLVARHRIIYENLLAVRLNPRGLEDQLTLAYRARLYGDPRPIWRDSHVGIAFTPTLNPSVARIGGTVELRPLTILSLSAGYYWTPYFGTQGHVQSFDSPFAPHSDSDLEAGDEAGRGYATSGTEVQLRAQLLAKVGPIVLRNDTSFFGGQLDLEGNDRLYYNPRSDLLVPNGGWSFTSDTDLVYLSSFGLIAGVRATVGHALYRDDDYDALDADENPNTPAVRAGPLLAYVFYDHPGSAFNKPTVLAIANWWLSHRYRTGEDVSQAFPYLVLAFRVEGELWRND
jgi:hypothetical protein